MYFLTGGVYSVHTLLTLYHVYATADTESNDDI